MNEQNRATPLTGSETGSYDVREINIFKPLYFVTLYLSQLILFPFYFYSHFTNERLRHRQISNLFMIIQLINKKYLVLHLGNQVPEHTFEITMLSLVTFQMTSDNLSSGCDENILNDQISIIFFYSVNYSDIENRIDIIRLLSHYFASIIFHYWGDVQINPQILPFSFPPFFYILWHFWAFENLK